MPRIRQHTHTNFIDCGSQGSCIRFTADAKGGPERLWFDFDIEVEAGDDEQYMLELHHCDTLLGGGHAQGFIHPVWKADNADWQRLDEPERMIGDDGRFIFRWSVPRPEKRGRFAPCFPYQRTDLDEFLANKNLRCDNIGVSAQGRAFPRIVNRMDEVGSEKPGVFITARQHASETPGSWVLEGILSAFDQAEENDPLLWVIPLVDLDGVEEGRYGKNHFPLDHNRSWYACGLCHETRIAMTESQRWAERCTPTLYLDLHAPGLMEQGAYFFSGIEEPDPEMKAFLELLEPLFGHYASDKFIRQSGYQARANAQVGTPTALSANVYFKEQFDIIATTLECSYQGFGDKPASKDDYRAVGTAIAAGIRQHCRALAGVAV